jgi:hypothetical protein
MNKYIILLLFCFSEIAFAFQIHGLGGKCLDVRRSSRVILFQCTGAPNQNWTFTNNGDLVGVDNKCLDVDGFNSADGTRVHLYNCHGGLNQKWSFSQYGEIIGLGGKCLDVSGGKSINGARIVIFRCHGGPNQKWSFH